MPALSIIIPTFNSVSVLGRALDSIVSQTFTDWEVLVMDGASKDDTVAIAQSYQDGRIRIFSEPDKGIYDAMNKGIKKSQGEWLYFLGSDDYLLNPGVLETIFAQGIDEYDVVYGDVESSVLDSRHKGEWKMKDIDFNRCHQCILYQRRIFKRLGLYDIRCKVMADYIFNLQWFLSRTIRNKYFPIQVACFSDGGFSSRFEDKAYSAIAADIILRKAYSKLHCSDKIRYAKCVKRETSSLLKRNLCGIILPFLQMEFKIRAFLRRMLNTH